MTAEKLDSHYSIETPEGVVLNIVPAGPVIRTLAFMIDLMIRGVASGVVLFLLSMAGRAGLGVYLVFWFLMEWFYPVLFEVLSNGATPGKKAMKIEVVHDDGTPVSFSSSLIRNLLRVIDFLPFLYCVGFMIALSTKQFKRIGDLAAGTAVIYKPDTGELSPEVASHESVKGIPTKVFTLPVDQQKMIVEFAERANELSVARQEELALLLSGYLENDHPPELVRILNDSAAGLRGR